MKRLILTVCLLCAATIGVFAQKEANNWFFGQYGGLTWNTTRSFDATGTTGDYGTTPAARLDNMPTFVDGCQIGGFEGCFSLSDANGELLFYGDGTTLWDKNSNVMLNGTTMGGNGTSAQSGIILPYPGHAHQYIAVSIEALGTSKMQYAIVDMTGNGGLGAVTSKNNEFSGYSGHVSESVTSIRHANRLDYWIVAPGRGNVLYLNSYLVTSSGVNSSNPEVTDFRDFGISSTTSTGSSGYIKFSPNGKHFVWATWSSNNGNAYYGDFNPQDGTFSNIKELPGSRYYGVEFSPSGDYLYLTVASQYGGQTATNELHIYDFSELQAATNPSTVSRKEFKPQAGTGYGAVQLGPDKRIYLASGWSGGATDSRARRCYVIDNPEEYDNLNIYQLDNFIPASTIAGGVSQIPRFYSGFPSFAASWWDMAVSHDKEFPVCYNEEITFTAELNVSGSPAITKIRWSYGDGDFDDDDDMSQALFSQKHTYKKPGTYTLTVTPYEGDTPVLEKMVSLEVPISPCMIPVNPKIHMSK